MLAGGEGGFGALERERVAFAIHDEKDVTFLHHLVVGNEELRDFAGNFGHDFQ
ncbi:hypothetical protein D3C86_2243480 [compost metagenome]